MQVRQRAIIVALMVGGFAAGSAQANQLVNGDFETGNLNGWTVFTTGNGTNGTGLPDVALFDTNNVGNGSLSARFNVGQIEAGTSPVGGGIFQSVVLTVGTFLLALDVAMLDDTSVPNADGGLIELLFDNVVVDSHDFRQADLNVPEYASLSAVLPGVSAGAHEVRIRLTRIYTSNLLASPYQYVDNISLSLVPGPMTLGLLAIGAAFTRRRRRST